MRGFFRGKFGVNLKPSTTSIHLPSRPFIRQTFDKNTRALGRVGQDLGWLVMRNKQTIKQALENWGDQFVAMIRAEVAAGNNFAPNKPLTIKQKGEGKHPLQDSGRLMQSLKSVVESK